jgi:glycerophosphoryl diester phosphodiesterase
VRVPQVMQYFQAGWSSRPQFAQVAIGASDYRERVPPPRPLVIGHRGASGYRPEHTRSAYELAITLGVDAIEPDIVATRDGVLVLRHENEISGTTDVARRPEFADRRATKRVDGVSLTGWFTEDFTWAELSTLRATERLPQVRQASASFDGTEGILRLRDLLDILDAGAERTGREISIVAEVKHPTYFASIALPLDELIADELKAWDDGGRTIVECFEQTVLGEIRGRGVAGRFVYLLESRGSAPDQVARLGNKALPYSAQLTDAGLARLAKEVDGVSVDKSLLLKTGGGDLVVRAHGAGLEVFTWTLRPENRFLAAGYRLGSAARDWGDWRGEFHAVLATGVDGIFVDHPDLGVAARAEVAGRS